MKKIAIFGKPGSGKSTVAKRLAAALSIEHYALDMLQYQPNGEPLARPEFDAAHQGLLMKPSWIIDGLGPLSAFNERIHAADTLIYIDLPYWQSYWLVTKRLLKALWQKPEGWPEGSSVLKGTLQSYKTLRRCPAFWNDAFWQQLVEKSNDKKLYRLCSLKALDHFIQHQLIE